MALTDLRPVEPDAVHHFCYGERTAFSAVTIFCGCQRLIVHNDHHSKRRQTSNLAHELSHALLLHPPTPPLSEHGCRNFDAAIEEEANWLAGSLLIPHEAAFLIARRGVALDEAADAYGVSPKMMQFRLNVTGALMFQQRLRRRARGIQAIKRVR
jgi:Zn-dependent peptidase ImmA (M78 family)